MSRNISDLHPVLQQKIAELQSLCVKNNLKIGIGECLRTVAEQDALYAKGRTAPGNKVTNARGVSYSSQHQWGVAFDFYRNDGKGAYNETGDFFKKVGQLAKSIGLGWGGDWKNPVDKPHLYLSNWGKTPCTLKEKYGTPPKFFATWDKTAYSTPQEPNSTVYSKIQFIKDIQKAIGAKVDGIVGSETLSKTVTVSRYINSKHAVVKPIQQYLNFVGYNCGAADGIAGTKFNSAVKIYQKENGCVSDGVITQKLNTWKKLLGLT